MLRGCPEAISRLLKAGGSVLLAAKILVLSRLLHKKLSQYTDSPPYLEVLRTRLASLRRRLLTRIDRQLQSLEASDSVLVEAMCAFSLATSSSATDVLRHFLHVRQSTMSELGTRRDGDRAIFKSLKVFVKSLKDCQVIAPTQLARALEGLKSIPLLQTPDLRSLLELNLDIHQRWLREDIDDFIPYIRHDDLQKTEAARILKHWARQAFSSFLKHLRDKLEEVKDTAVIMGLRQEMLDLWFSNQRHSMIVDTSEVLQGIRDAFNDRLQSLIDQYSGSLSNVASTIDSLFESWESGVSEDCPPMWDNSTVITTTASGGEALKEALSIRAYGRSKPVRAVSATYTTWLDGIHALESTIQKTREKKWTDDLDETNDDEDVLEDKHVLLSEADPRLLQETLNNALTDNFERLYDTIQAHAEKLQGGHHSSVEAGHKSCFLLRVWREISHQLPSSYPNSQNKTDFIAVLQTRISTAVLQQPLSRYETRTIKSLRQTRLQTRILWEGDPQLPVLPSPYVFRLLYDIMGSMTVFGADIWTPQTTSILKRQLTEALAPIMSRLPDIKSQVNGYSLRPASSSRDSRDPNNSEENDEQILSEKGNETSNENDQQEDLREAQTNKTNAHTPNEPDGPSEETARDMKIQRLFDVFYLQNATKINNADLVDDLDRTQSAISTSSDLTDRDVNRMKKNAEAYWRRTELLFALLAQIYS